MKRLFSEDDCQAAQIRYLTGRRDTKRDLMFCAIPNAAKRGYKLAAVLKATGLVAGAPDLVIWLKGRVLHIENKVKPNKTTASQDWFAERLKALGHEYRVITAETPGDAVDKLIAIMEAT